MFSSLNHACVKGPRWRNNNYPQLFLVPPVGAGRWSDIPYRMNPERKRGYQEARMQLEALRARWPQAFSAKSHLVRPLMVGALRVIADEMGWPRP
jgi:hypothetical protein